MKKKYLKLLLSSCFFIPFMAHASGVQFTLLNLNSFPPIPNPIHVTGGYIIYDFAPLNGVLPDGCPTTDHPVQVDLSTIINFPYPITLGSSDSYFTFNIPSNLEYCFKSSTWANIILFITQMDGIDKHTGSCGIGSMLKAGDNNYSSLNITETTGQTPDFFCNFRISLKL